MKRSEILFGLLKIPIDALAVFAALIAAYRLREANIDLILRVQFLKPLQLPAFSYYLWHFVAGSVVLYLLILAVLGLYALKVTLSSWREVGRVIVAAVLWLMLIISWFFLVEHDLIFSRALLMQATVLSAVFVILGRAIVQLVQRACLRRGIGIRSVLSIGAHHLPEIVRRTLVRDVRFTYLGHAQSIHSLIGMERNQHIDLVLHTDPNPGSSQTLHLINHCRSHHLGYAFLPSVFADVPHQLLIQRLGMVPVLHFQPTPLDGWGRVVKRASDVVGSLALLVILSPLLLLLALAIFITGGRPIVYVSERVGQHGGKLVPILKFRTMRRDAEELKPQLQVKSHRDGPLFKVKDDPRVTPLGKFLRRWSLDELPQLFNVLLGHLSLVGPRPHLPSEVAQYSEDQRRVFTVKPGITGLAQVSGRSDLKFEDEVRFDLQYVEEWSMGLDLWIMWRTAVVVLWGEGAD